MPTVAISYFCNNTVNQNVKDGYIQDSTARIGTYKIVRHTNAEINIYITFVTIMGDGC